MFLASLHIPSLHFHSSSLSTRLEFTLEEERELKGRCARIPYRARNRQIRAR